jgi:hypothetical protein
LLQRIRQFSRAPDAKLTWSGTWFLLGDKKVAQNFKIIIHRSIDNLYLRLMGDFDGSSAFELFNTLKDNLNSTKCILIDTHKLKAVYPFGREVFYYNFSKIKNQRIRIRFVGPNAQHLASSQSITNEGPTPPEKIHY